MVEKAGAALRPFRVHILTTAVLLGAALPASAQDLLQPPPPPAWSVASNTDAMGNSARIELVAPDDAYRFSVGAFGRFSWPFGKLDDQEAVIVGNTVLIPDHLRYSDLFETGWGVSLEASFNFYTEGKGGHRGPMDSGGLRAGLYVSVQRDSYEGDRVSDGAFFIDPDDMTLTSGYIGVKVITGMGGSSYGEAHLGIGVARFDSVDAQVATISGDQTQELFEESQEFALESRYRFSARLGPLALTGGVGIRYISGPDEGDSDVGHLLDAHAFWTFDLDFGVELGF